MAVVNDNRASNVLVKNELKGLTPSCETFELHSQFAKKNNMADQQGPFTEAAPTLEGDNTTAADMKAEQAYITAENSEPVKTEAYQQPVRTANQGYTTGAN